MAVEGVELNAMSGGNTVAVDRIDSKDFQLMKLVTGEDGTNGGMVTDANPYPTKIISIAAGDNNIGNVDIVSSALPTGAATESTLATVGALLATGIPVTNFPATQPVSGTVSVTDVATSTKQDTAQTALDAIKTAAELIDNAISGNEMQVDIVTMPNVTIANASIPITDNAGSLTVDAPVGTPVFVRLSDGSSAITTLPVSLASVPSHAVTNAGTFATQVTSISAGDNNIGNVDVVTLPSIPAGTNNIGDVDVLTLPSLPAGTNAIGKLAANSGVDIGDVDVTSISNGSNLIGDVGLQGRTTGGLTYYKNLDVDESEDDIKTSAGTLYWLHAMNLSSGKRYLKIYDSTAASVTVGTTTPVLTFPIPTQGDTNGAGFTFNIPQGIAFTTGICIAATTGLADNDTGAPGANEIVLNAAYK